MPARRYKASFSDGRVLTRGTNRDYAAAWQVKYFNDPAPEGVWSTPGQQERSGFARTRELAIAAVTSELNAIARRSWSRDVTHEVVATEAA